MQLYDRCSDLKRHVRKWTSSPTALSMASRHPVSDAGEQSAFSIHSWTSKIPDELAVPIYRSFQVETHRQRLRENERASRGAKMAYKIPSEHVSSVLQGDDPPEAYLSKIGLQKLVQNINRSAKMSVSRSSERTNSVKTHPSGICHLVQVITSDDEDFRLKCLDCAYFEEYCIPCDHILAVNKGNVSVHAFDVHWIKRFIDGDMDESLRYLTTDDLVQLPRLHRPDWLSDPIHQDATPAHNCDNDISATEETRCKFI